MPRPSERLITRMLYWLWTAIACWMAAMTVLSVACPLASSARKLMMLALGAMPRRVVQLVQFELVPLPAMMLATWVPCPYRSLVVVDEGSKLALYTTRLVVVPGTRRSAVVLTPLSITA